MKITFTNQKAINGIRVYSIQVDAATKAQRNTRSIDSRVFTGKKQIHDLIMSTPPVKMINGVEYLDI